MTVLFIGCNCLSQIPPQYIYIDEDCKAVLPDYRDFFEFSDNCAVKDTIQLPAPGTPLTIILNPISTVEIVIRDYSNNTDFVQFDVILVDTIPPIITPKTMLLGILDEYDLTGGSKLRATPVIVRGNGVLRELSAYHIGYPDNKMNLAVYTDRNGRPDALLTSTGEVPCNTNMGWQIEPVQDQIEVNEGEKLWIAFMTDSEDDKGVQASPIDRMSDVAANTGIYTSSMPAAFGDSKQYEWSHSVHMRYTLTYDKPVEIIAEEYLEVERYINTQIQAYVDDFNWSTAAIDTVFQKPKCIPIGSIIPN